MNNTFNNNVVSDSVLDRIKKILCLASELNDSVEQRELAMIKAQKIAAEYNVDLKLINIFDKSVKKAPIEKKDGISLGQRKSICQDNVGRIIQNHFNCKVLYHGNRARGRSMILIGTKDNIELGEYINSYLNETFLSLWRNEYAKGMLDLRERESYLLGIEKGLSDKLTNEQTNVETEKLSAQPEEVKQSFALMVVSEKERLDEALGEFYPNLRKSYKYSRHGFNPSALEKGMAAGSSISIRKAISYSNLDNRIATQLI